MVKAGLHKATSLMAKVTSSSTERFFQSAILHSQASSCSSQYKPWNGSYINNNGYLEESNIF